MSYRSGAPARLSVETHDDLLPVEVRDHKLRLVASGCKLRDVELAAGMYVVSTKLPGHEELLEAVRLEPGQHHRVELAPEPKLLRPQARYVEGFETTQQAVDPATLPPFTREPIGREVAAALPTWSLRFLRSGADFRLQPLNWTPEITILEDDPNRTVLQITVPEQVVVFAQVAQAGQVPMNIALPATGVDASATCVVTAEARAGHLFVGALPAGSRVASRAAEYLAAEQVGNGAAVVGTSEAEALLRGKLIDPISAAVGGYLLLRSNELDRLHDWPERLASLLPWFPDGAVIAGETAAKRGQIDQAVRHLLEVPTRGLPIFTDGYSMLVARTTKYQSNTKLGSAIDPSHRDALNRFLRRLTEWSTFVDFSAPTLTFAAADPNDPAATQSPLDPASPGWVFTRPQPDAGPRSNTVDAAGTTVDVHRDLGVAAPEVEATDAAHGASTGEPTRPPSPPQDPPATAQAPESPPTQELQNPPNPPQGTPAADELPPGNRTSQSVSDPSTQRRWLITGSAMGFAPQTAATVYVDDKKIATLPAHSLDHIEIIVRSHHPPGKIHISGTTASGHPRPTSSFSVQELPP